MIIQLSSISIEPAALRSLCSGDTVNYVCNRVSGIISWEVWCLSSSSETFCSDSYTSGQQILTRENATTNQDHCTSTHHTCGGELDVGSCS